MTDTEAAITACYGCIAESSLLRDAEHARCASDFLHQLVPEPRSGDALVTEPTQRRQGQPEVPHP